MQFEWWPIHIKNAVIVNNGFVFSTLAFFFFSWFIYIVLSVFYKFSTNIRKTAYKVSLATGKYSSE